MAVLADVIVGRPGSTDESGGGGDGAAAFVFGPEIDAVAKVVEFASVTDEILDRWRTPGSNSGAQWEERFGLDRYTPLVERVIEDVLEAAQTSRVDHAVLVSSNSAVTKKASALVRCADTVSISPLGYAGGAASVGVAWRMPGSSRAGREHPGPLGCRWRGRNSSPGDRPDRSRSSTSPGYRATRGGSTGLLPDLSDVEGSAGPGAPPAAAGAGSCVGTGGCQKREVEVCSIRQSLRKMWLRSSPTGPSV